MITSTCVSLPPSCQGVANKDEAEKCVELGRKFLRAGEYAKAIKFLDKSIRLYPLPGIQELKARAEAEQRRKAEAHNHSSSNSSSSTSSTGGEGVHRRHNVPRSSSSTSSNGGGDESKAPTGKFDGSFLW